jgi:hypothetical protein
VRETLREIRQWPRKQIEAYVRERVANIAQKEYQRIQRGTLYQRGVRLKISDFERIANALLLEAYAEGRKVSTNDVCKHIIRKAIEEHEALQEHLAMQARFEVGVKAPLPGVSSRKTPKV